MAVPDRITHYFEAAEGPFRSLSAQPPDQAEAILQYIRTQQGRFASLRKADYFQVRIAVEHELRQKFLSKGGHPQLPYPHYFVLGECDWVLSWFRQGRQIVLPLTEIHPDWVSFTYGDSFPALRIKDNQPFRGQVFTLEELPGLISRFGLPQEINPDGAAGPERYIEAQVWSEIPLKKWLNQSVNTASAPA